jgi:hypothetical protein
VAPADRTVGSSPAVEGGTGADPEEPPAPDAPAPGGGLRRAGIVLVALGVLAIVVVGALLLGLL